MKKLGVLVIVLLLLYGIGHDGRQEYKAIWKSGYAEGYEAARRGVKIGSPNYGPKSEPPQYGRGEDPPKPSKADYRLHYEAYSAGHEAFALGFGYNDTPPDPNGDL